jgi:hypothetical protein
VGVSLLMFWVGSNETKVADNQITIMDTISIFIYGVAG